MLPPPSVITRSDATRQFQKALFNRKDAKDAKMSFPRRRESMDSPVKPGNDIGEQSSS